MLPTRIVSGTFPPGYCRKFQGVTCNRLNQVASLDLSELSTKRLRGGVPLQRLLHIATRLPALKVSMVPDTFAH